MARVRYSPSRGKRSADIWGHYEPDTGSIQYIVADPDTSRAAIVDPVWNFDPNTAATSTEAADELLRHVEEHGLAIEWILDTHPHADHFTAGGILAAKLGAPHCIGEKVAEVADIWRDLYSRPDAFDVERDFDRLFADGDSFEIGSLPVRVMLSPGHTVASITYVVGDDAAFVHDTLMYPDSGSSRADFPGGSSKTLYGSIRQILDLPEKTRLFVGHDYGKDGRDPAWEATVAEHRRDNIHVRDGIGKAEYVELRDARDATLDLPDRMLFALQVNLRGGRLPRDDDGNEIFRIPANRF